MRLLFYDWELAVPPEYCAYNTGCNNTAVCVVSVSVSGGALCVLALKQAGKDRQYRANVPRQCWRAAPRANHLQHAACSASSS